MSDSMFLIKDKNSKSIKQDHNGMLCMFTDKSKAEMFLHRRNVDNKKESEIIEVDVKIKAS